VTKHDCGYTVIEALCAFAILSVVLVALYSVGGTSSRQLVASDEADRAMLLARSKLDELAAVPAPLPRSQAGLFTGTNIAWRIDSETAPESAKDFPELQLQTVRLTLKWPTVIGADEFVVTTRHIGFERR
jgi:Tfp pilus assembly protein PilV